VLAFQIRQYAADASSSPFGEGRVREGGADIDRVTSSATLAPNQQLGVGSRILAYSSRQRRSQPSNSCSRQTRKNESSPPPRSPRRCPLFRRELGEFLCLGQQGRALRFQVGGAFGIKERSKYFFPSIQVCRQTVRESSGGPDQMAISASLPAPGNRRGGGHGAVEPVEGHELERLGLGCAAVFHRFGASV